MRKQTLKTKYLVQISTVIFSFVFLVASASASEITSDNIIKYVNLARSAQGIDEVVPNDKLMQIAKDKLNDMLANKYFAHTSPTGVNPWHWFQEEGYDYHFAGENLAINFQTAENEQEAWMKSPTHRKNILDPNYQEIGVAVGTQVTDGQTSIIAVQEFGTTFAGVSKGGKTFAPFKDSALKTDAGQIIPQVLSAKNVLPEQSNLFGGNGGQQAILNWFSDNKIKIIDHLFFGAMILMIFSIALMAIAFLSVAFDKTWSILERAKAKKVEKMA